MVRRNTKYEKRFKEQINRNKSIVGDSIEIMIERIKEGEGVDGIADRDLVYNSDETAEVNPITNIRSDRSELRLEEKINEQGYKRSKMNVVKKEEEKVEKAEEGGSEDLAK